ncbi:hypothetical protein JCM10213_004850 [Rhodosporidiobolus nylandii]
MQQHLVSVPNVKLSHLAGGTQSDLFEGTVTLALHRGEELSSSAAAGAGGPAAAGVARAGPPALPPRPSAPPSYDTPTSSSSSSTSRPPSSLKQHEYLLLSLAIPPSTEAVFEMPVSLADTASSIVASPPSSFILPNLTGVDPASLAFVKGTTDQKGLPRETENGFIKLTLPSGEGTVDPETRELFEAALFGMYRGEGVVETRGPERVDDPALPPSANQLYLVDEDSGRVLGELATDGIILEEGGALAQGKMDDTPGSKAGGASLASLDGHEPVVIDSLFPSAADTAVSPSITYTVKPVSAYLPAENPQGSNLITAANFLSRGIIVGTELLSDLLSSGAGKYVASRPATQTPMVFQPRTKAALDKGYQVTQTATVYSGKAARAVGGLAAKVGDKLGKSTGIQSQPGGPPPTGWRGALASTLTAVNTVADHLEAGGKTLLDSSSQSASQVIHHRYGSEARGVADSVGGSVKHCALVYIDARGVGRKALLKSVGKSALRAKMADGSELYLTNESGELKQIETSVQQGGNVPLALEGRASGSTTPYSAYGGGERSAQGSGRTSPLPPPGYGQPSGSSGVGGGSQKEKKA